MRDLIVTLALPMADLLNLGGLQGTVALASVGGAGTFDGIFPAGILAVLLARLSWRR